MQNLMNAQNITLSGGETIDSQQLLVMVKVPHAVPGGRVTQMSVVDEEAFKNALDKMMLRAEKRGSQWYHPKMGRFSVTA